MGRNYSRKDIPSSSDLALIWDSANSDWRLSPVSGVATTVNALNTELASAVQEPVSQYLSPLTGFTFTLEGTDNIHLMITPVGALANGTITMPVSPGAVDKQTVLISTSQAITTLTVEGNGATLVGAPATLLAGGFFTMKYDTLSNTWNRVG